MYHFALLWRKKKRIQKRDFVIEEREDEPLGVFSHGKFARIIRTDTYFLFVLTLWLFNVCKIWCNYHHYFYACFFSACFTQRSKICTAQKKEWLETFLALVTFAFDGIPIVMASRQRDIVPFRLDCFLFSSSRKCILNANKHTNKQTSNK